MILVWMGMHLIASIPKIYLLILSLFTYGIGRKICKPQVWKRKVKHSETEHVRGKDME